jgi:hypothetical protein
MKHLVSHPHLLLPLAALGDSKPKYKPARVVAEVVVAEVVVAEVVVAAVAVVVVAVVVAVVAAVVAVVAVSSR